VALSLELKRPGREDNHPFSYIPEIKNACTCTSSPTYISEAWWIKSTRTNLPFIFNKYNYDVYILMESEADDSARFNFEPLKGTQCLKV
jgi:hypothetical protein